MLHSSSTTAVLRAIDTSKWLSRHGKPIQVNDSNNLLAMNDLFDCETKVNNSGISMDDIVSCTALLLLWHDNCYEG